MQVGHVQRLCPPAYAAALPYRPAAHTWCAPQRCPPVCCCVRSAVQGSYLAGLTAAYFGQLLDLTQIVQVGEAH